MARIALSLVAHFPAKSIPSPIESYCARQLASRAKRRDYRMQQVRRTMVAWQGCVECVRTCGRKGAPCRSGLLNYNVKNP